MFLTLFRLSGSDIVRYVFDRCCVLGKPVLFVAIPIDDCPFCSSGAFIHAILLVGCVPFRVRKVTKVERDRMCTTIQ